MGTNFVKGCGLSLKLWAIYAMRVHSARHRGPAMHTTRAFPLEEGEWAPATRCVVSYFRSKGAQNQLLHLLLIQRVISGFEGHKKIVVGKVSQFHVQAQFA